MSEWQKILISTIAGMLAGLVGGLALEPLKHWVTHHFTAKRATKNIYKEIAQIYQMNVVAANERPFPRYNLVAIQSLTTETFDFYYDQQREAFYAVPESESILGLYRMLRRVRGIVLQSPTVDVADEAAQQIAVDFERRFASQLLDDSLIQKYRQEMRGRMNRAYQAYIEANRTRGQS